MTHRSNDYSKPCAKCHATLPLTSYTFHNGYWDGLEGTCKGCRKLLKAKFTPIQQEQYRINNYSAGYKRCSDCKCYLELAQYCKKLKYRDGLSYICRGCELVKNKPFVPVDVPPEELGGSPSQTQEPEITPIIKKKRILFSM